MKILFVSKLDGDLTRGPSNSVPQQIKGLAENNNVLWLNISKNIIISWDNLNYYKSIKKVHEIIYEIGLFEPDIAVFQQVYHFEFYKIGQFLLKRKIPYVVVPRSSLTYLGQKRKYYKKIIGNAILFNSFIKNASSIHFLTNEEKEQSKRFMIQQSFIIPNGISSPISEKTFLGKSIKATFIGRIEIFQKGLDLLVDAVNISQHTLRKSNFHLSIHGPDIDGSVNALLKTVNNYLIHDIISFKPQITNYEKSKILMETDIFILTSRYEGLPMGLLEALSFGIPSLVTKGTNLSNQILEYNAGWIADNDAQSISEILIKAVDEKMIYSEISKNAKLLSHQYSWNKISETTLEEFRKILNIKE